MHDITSLLKNKLFKGLEPYNISKVLSIFSAVCKYSEIETNSFTIFKQILYNCLIDNYIYINETKPDSKILFFYSHIYYRNDHFNSFKNIANIIKNKDIVYPEKLHTQKINIKKFFIIIFFILNWNKSLKEKSIGTNLRLLILNELVELYKFHCIISKIKTNKYNLLVTYYDASPLENMVVQYFKQNGVKTATLQHGMFVSRRPELKKIDFEGIELSKSISDYFLAWNELTKAEAIKSGINEEKIKVLGIPKYANYKRKKVCKKNRNEFGIILNVVDFDNQNIDLINYANQLAQEFDLKYKVKYHPSFKGNEYEQIIDEKFCNGIFEKTVTIADYINMVEFTLISNSSVFVELVYLKHLTYRLTYNDLSDKYRGITENTFNSKEQLFKNYYSRELGERNMDLIFDYLCTCEDVGESYRNFFDDFQCEE